MDVAVFSYLNTLAARASALGWLAVATGQHGIFLYALLFLGLRVHPGRDALRGRRLVVLAAVAVVLSPGVNAGLNAIVPRLAVLRSARSALPRLAPSGAFLSSRSTCSSSLRVAFGWVEFTGAGRFHQTGGRAHPREPRSLADV